jgi:TrmH family RNA methyltransferase
MPQSELSRTAAGRLRALRQRGNREKEGRFLAEGVRVVEELLQSTIEIDSIVISDTVRNTPRGSALVAGLRPDIRVYSAGEPDLRQLADTDAPQGIIACGRIPQGEMPVPAPKFVVVLDGVQDPGNFGTLVRSAAAFGVGAVVTLPGTVDAWNAKSIRSSAGTVFHVPIVSHTTAELQEWCARESVSLWGAAAEGDVLRTIDRPDKLALVIGNEGAGLRPDMRTAFDRIVALNMAGPAESLNAAVAGGILMYLLSGMS